MFTRRFGHTSSASGTLTFVILVVCGIASLVWWYDRVNTKRWELFQTLLNLSANMEHSRFSSKRVDKSFEELSQGTADAVFSDAQLSDFLARSDGNAERSTGPSRINFTPVVSYSQQSLAWTKPPFPQRVGNHALVFDGLLTTAGSAASDLRVFCLALIDPRAWNDPSPKSVYVAKGCSELTRDEAPSRVVLAVVDVAAKTLKLRVE